MAIQAENAGLGGGRVGGGSGFSWMESGCYGGSDPFCVNLKRINLQNMQKNGVLPPVAGGTNDGVRPPTFSSYSSQIIHDHDEKQAREIDHYIRAQNERLRWVIHAQTKQMVELLSRRIESKALALLSQKELEIAKASSRAMELEGLVRKLEMEKMTWQRAAMENEAMVVSLNNTLDEVRGSNACRLAGEDAESCCDDKRDDKAAATLMACKSCGECKDSCFLFLPCRHLCACKDCVPFLDVCPSCGAPRQAVVEALIS